MTSTRLPNFAILMLIVTMIACSQKKSNESSVAKPDTPYVLIAPIKWNVEQFGIPIEFAPTIPYSGIEDIRFAPGWDDASSNGYWSYAFLWYLEGKKEINPKAIEENLTAYYKGLVGRNITKRSIPDDKLVDVVVKMNEASITEGDLQTYSGTVDMLDYMAQKPMTLNCIVHVKECPGQPDNTFIFHELSPRPLTDDVWKDLNNLWTAFECGKTK